MSPLFSLQEYIQYKLLLFIRKNTTTNTAAKSCYYFHQSKCTSTSFHTLNVPSNFTLDLQHNYNLNEMIFHILIIFQPDFKQYIHHQQANQDQMFKQQQSDLNAM